MHWKHELLQRLQEVRGNCKTRNQLIHISRQPFCREEEAPFIAIHTLDALAYLLPDAPTLRLAACDVDPTAAQITLQVCSTQTRVPCPLCATPARRIHSRYTRTLADLQWAQYRVRLQLRVRRWFGHTRPCRRRIFTERRLARSMREYGLRVLCPGLGRTVNNLTMPSQGGSMPLRDPYRIADQQLCNTFP